jgi:competence protein ComEA
MRKFKVVVPVLVAVVALLVSGISVYAGDAAKVNINTATVEELTQLQGIGPKYAAQIVEYREQKGPFASPEDLLKVPGIGQKTFDKNKDVIVVE